MSGVIGQHIAILNTRGANMDRNIRLLVDDIAGLEIKENKVPTSWVKIFVQLTIVIVCLHLQMINARYFRSLKRASFIIAHTFDDVVCYFVQF